MLSHSLTRLHALEVINRSSLHSRGEITEGALGRWVGVLDTGDGGVAIGGLDVDIRDWDMDIGMEMWTLGARDGHTRGDGLRDHLYQPCL